MTLSSFTGRFGPAALYPMTWGGIASLAVYALIRWVTAQEGRALDEVGLGWSTSTLLRLIAGLALGVAIVATILAASTLLLGPIHFTAASQIDSSAVALALTGLAATVVMEELVFRSYALWTCVAAFGIWRGQAMVVAAFAALHLLYGWPVATVLMGVLPSAVLFGAAAIVSRGLALPIGLHLGMVAARLVSGETDRPLVFVLDTSAIDPARAVTLAPWIGGSVPLLVAAGLTLVWGRKSAAPD